MTCLDPDISHCQANRYGASKKKRWIITVAATAISTYALDVIATAAGLILVFLGLLDSAAYSHVLLFLACTYIFWAAGLHVNLKANWALLEATDTSTNVASKIAYDVVKYRTSSSRARRIAADIGYVGTEFAKEAPYYAGAFGAVLLSDSVSAREAIIFLAGANLGAAAYEYGLAQLVRAHLRQ